MAEFRFFFFAGGIRCGGLGGVGGRGGESSGEKIADSGQIFEEAELDDGHFEHCAGESAAKHLGFGIGEDLEGGHDSLHAEFACLSEQIAAVASGDAAEGDVVATGECDHEIAYVADGLVHEFAGLDAGGEAGIEDAEDFAGAMFDDSGEEFEESIVAGGTEHAVDVISGDCAIAEGEELVEE